VTVRSIHPLHGAVHVTQTESMQLETRCVPSAPQPYEQGPYTFPKHGVPVTGGGFGQGLQSVNAPYDQTPFWHASAQQHSMTWQVAPSAHAVPTWPGEPHTGQLDPAEPPIALLDPAEPPVPASMPPICRADVEPPHPAAMRLTAKAALQPSNARPRMRHSYGFCSIGTDPGGTRNRAL
jgi:hypothetical protein